MPELSKLTEGLDYFARLSMPLRLVVWLILTSAAFLITTRLNYPDHPPLAVRIGVIVAGSLVLLTVLLQSRPTEWYRRMPKKEPVICKSILYLSFGAKMSTEKKSLIREYQNARIKSHEFALSELQMQDCAVSEWEFDRIVLYLYEELKLKPDFKVRIEHVVTEKELLNAGNWKSSLSPLHYAVRSVAALGSNDRPLVAFSREQLSAVKEIYRRLNTPWSRLCRFREWDFRGKQIFENCNRLLNGHF
jgi:hypothetical protein